MNLLDNTLTRQISGGYAVTLLPYIQVQMIFLTLNLPRLFLCVHAVYDYMETFILIVEKGQGSKVGFP